MKLFRINHFLRRVKKGSSMNTLIDMAHFGPPTLAQPVSQACTQSQFDEEAYAFWCEQIHETPRRHRKQWEFCFILQALARYGMLAPGRRGLGFGVGTEPLVSVFAANGARVTATDMAPDDASRIGWVETNQYAASKQALNQRGICPPALFDANVEFQVMDMNAIPADAGQFDFTWSACAFEHLGSIELGVAFILENVRLLKPGGVMVHTTELNCVSDTDTLDHAGTVLYRKRDFERMADALRRAGCKVELNFNLGDGPVDQHIDVPPYTDDNHLKLQIAEWVTTSYGLIAQKL